MRAQLEISAEVSGDATDFKALVQDFVNALNNEYEATDLSATIEPLDTDVIEIEPE